MSNTIYVEHANMAFSRASKNYDRLIKSINDYPEVNHDNFNVEIFFEGIKGSNTHSLFIYGYKVNINLTLIFEGDNGYLGRVLCCFDNGEIITEFYIEPRGDLIHKINPDYPKDYFGSCGETRTATAFLTELYQEVLEKN